MPFDMIGTKTNKLLLEVMVDDLGLEEWPGARHNPEVLELGPLAGIDWFTRDEIAWCAIWVGAKLAMIGVPGTGSAMARSYLNWGRAVPLSEIMPGDICVIPRGSNPDQGHVFAVHHIEGDTIWGIGGNQGNKVSIAPYTMSQILPDGVRRWDGSWTPQTNRATVRMGDRGVFVRDLQEQLRDLGYFHGAVDAAFGPLTGAAVRRFQVAEGLTADGVVGPRTWKALMAAEKAPAREVSITDLRKRGSRVIKGATQIDLTAGIGAVSGVIATASAAANQAETALDTVRVMVDQYGLWLLGGAIVVGVLLVIANGIKNARVDDAQSGANLRR
jgi:uncharacterized protein (TIGR02594 family)